MSFTLPALPWAYNALADKGISEEQVKFHYDKHHTGDLTKLNAAAKTNEDLGKKSIEELISTEKGPIYNLAAQIWNHSFYWQCMKPGGGGTPTGPIAEKIEASFGGYEKFVEAFKTAGATQFGSGWAWLVLKGGQLEVMKTPNADTPLAHGIQALLTVDVWEHAYYLDYQNRRPDYLSVFIEKLVNWDFVNSRL